MNYMEDLLSIDMVSSKSLKTKENSKSNFRLFSSVVYKDLFGISCPVLGSCLKILNYFFILVSFSPTFLFVKIIVRVSCRNYSLVNLGRKSCAHLRLGVLLSKWFRSAGFLFLFLFVLSKERFFNTQSPGNIQVCVCWEGDILEK